MIKGGWLLWKTHKVQLPSKIVNQTTHMNKNKENISYF